MVIFIFLYLFNNPGICSVYLSISLSISLFISRSGCLSNYLSNYMNGRCNGWTDNKVYRLWFFKIQFQNWSRHALHLSTSMYLCPCIQTKNMSWWSLINNAYYKQQKETREPDLFKPFSIYLYILSRLHSLHSFVLG